MLNSENQNIQTQGFISQEDQNIINYKEISILDTLEPKEKVRFIRFRCNCCYCCSCSCGPQGVKGKMNYFLSMSIVSLIFSIASVITSFNFISEYKDLKNILLLKLEEEKNYLKNDIKNLWCNFQSIQNCVLIIDFICIVLFLIFEIIQKVYYNTIISKEKKQGNITRIMILINYLFNFIFRFLVALSFFFFLYELIIIFQKPLEFKISISDSYISYLIGNYEKTEEEILFDELYNKCSKFGAINSVIIFIMSWFLVCLCYNDEIIYIYLDLNFENYKNFNFSHLRQIQINNQNKKSTIVIPLKINDPNIEDKIKTTSILKEGKNIDIQIKVNKNLYLQEINSKTILTFKEILLKNITNDFIYIKIKNESIKNMLSITDWEYPKLDQLYIYLNNSFVFSFIAIAFFIPGLFFHANDDPLYFQIKEELKKEAYSNISNINIYNYYGNFEIGVAESRFYLYLITLIILYIFMIKRAIFRSYTKSNLILIEYILSIFFCILNAIYIILNILLIVFSLLSMGPKEKYSEKNKIKVDTLGLIFSLQGSTSFIFLIFSCKLIVSSIYLLNYVSKMKNNFDNLNENKNLNEIEQNEIKYIGLDSSQHNLYEYIIEGHPRYLYYSLKKENRIDNNNLICGEQKNEKMDKKKSESEITLV